jgi:ketosteroid isomerase-like protein
MKRIAFAISVAVLVFGVTILAQAQTGSVEQELITLEHGWAEAGVKKDSAFFDRILADEFTGTDPEGNVATKAQYLAEMKSGEYVLASFVQDDVKVRTYGDAAVVTGRATVKGQYKGEEASGQYQWTDTFIKRDGRWQCVATHSSRIPQK